MVHAGQVTTRSRSNPFGITYGRWNTAPSGGRARRPDPRVGGDIAVVVELHRYSRALMRPAAEHDGASPPIVYDCPPGERWYVGPPVPKCLALGPWGRPSGADGCGCGLTGAHRLAPLVVLRGGNPVQRLVQVRDEVCRVLQ